jgi:hypothetical protein
MPVGVVASTSFPSSSGRHRFQKMDWFATVGPRTINFYRNGRQLGPLDMVQVKTADVDGIRRLATEKGRSDTV